MIVRISIQRRAHPRQRRGPGYPLVSFLPAAKKDTASIPCAAQRAKRVELGSFASQNSGNKHIDTKIIMRYNTRWGCFMKKVIIFTILVSVYISGVLAQNNVTNNTTITIQGNVYYFRPSTTPSSPPPTQSSDFLGSGHWYGEDAAKAWASIADWVVDHCLEATPAVRGNNNEHVYISAVHVIRESDRDWSDYRYYYYGKKQVRIDYWVVRNSAQMADGRRETRWFGF
jgi:hypothetical protein